MPVAWGLRVEGVGRLRGQQESAVLGRAGPSASPWAAPMRGKSRGPTRSRIFQARGRRGGRATRGTRPNAKAGGGAAEHGRGQAALSADGGVMGAQSNSSANKADASLAVPPNKLPNKPSNLQTPPKRPHLELSPAPRHRPRDGDLSPRRARAHVAPGLEGQRRLGAGADPLGALEGQVCRGRPGV